MGGARDPTFLFTGVLRIVLHLSFIDTLFLLAWVRHECVHFLTDARLLLLPTRADGDAVLLMGEEIGSCDVVLLVTFTFLMSRVFWSFKASMVHNIYGF